MPSTEAVIPTERAPRYLVQLCRHLSEMGRMHSALISHSGGRMPQVEHVEWSDDAAVIRFPNGTCTLRAAPDALLIRLDADDEAAMSALQRGFANRVRTIGRREGLQVEWRPVVAAGSAPARSSGGATARPSGRQPNPLIGLVLAAVVALVVGLHLAIGGALVASPWTGLAGGALVALAALAAAVVAAHLAVGGLAVAGGRLAHRRRRPTRPAPPGGEDRER
jgi:hypothetical protein